MTGAAARRRAPPSGPSGDRPHWETDGANWPNRAQSRFVLAGGLRWHIQEAGSGGPSRPLILLLHGTGAATHSFADVLPILADHARVLAVDLPGHGFTDNPGARWLAINAMSKSLIQLLDHLELEPDLAVGHSAGAALLVRMTIDRFISPRGIVSINGALLPFGGIGRTLFPQLAKLLFLNPFVPAFFARQGRDRQRVRKLLENTGSALTDAQVDRYATLMRYPSHISGALGMMANWDLEALKRDLPQLGTPLLLIAADRDKTVPPTDALEIVNAAPRARVLNLEGLGHLAHEEDPERVCRHILEFSQELLPGRMSTG
ncbi:MAG: alpha/beta fold hydrolase BchO [Pseudomonadota bacterium]